MSGKVKANLWLSTYVESGISPRAYLQEEMPPTRIVQEIFAASTMRHIRQCLQQNSARRPGHCYGSTQQFATCSYSSDKFPNA